MNLFIQLLKCGYLPKELPPCFSSESFGLAVESLSAGHPNGFSEKTSALICNHNLARQGTLRRRLGIPNPVPYYFLAHELASGWSRIKLLLDNDPYNANVPEEDESLNRAIIGTVPYGGDRRFIRLKKRWNARYILQSDVSQFYHSVYTHSVPWALEGKTAAKSNKQGKTLGNRLDLRLRNLQDKQTVGIPVGPDASFVISELILLRVGELLQSHTSIEGYRIIDDWEISARDLSDAEEAKYQLQEALREYELYLNPKKTFISALPLPLEEAWTAEIRALRIAEKGRRRVDDLVTYFDRSFSLAKQNRDKHVMKYALGRIRREVIQDEFLWSSLYYLLLQTCAFEAGVLPVVLRRIFEVGPPSYRVDKDALAEMLSAQIIEHSRQGHGSEVAWALWGAISANVKLSDAASKALNGFEDSVVGILSLDAKSKSLLSAGFDPSFWTSRLTKEELYGEHWLFVYEACLNGWLANASGKSPIEQDSAFKWMKSTGVSFYTSPPITI